MPPRLGNRGIYTPTCTVPWRSRPARIMQQGGEGTVLVLADTTLGYRRDWQVLHLTLSTMTTVSCSVTRVWSVRKKEVVEVRREEIKDDIGDRDVGDTSSTNINKQRARARARALEGIEVSQTTMDEPADSRNVRSPHSQMCSSRSTINHHEHHMPPWIGIASPSTAAH